MLSDGQWEQLRKIRKPKQPRQGRLRSQDGELVGSEVWAETMAKHLETVQWRVRPVGYIERPMPRCALPVSTEPITPEEVRYIIRKLRRNRAAGDDDIPAEYLQSVVEDERGLEWITKLCNECWEARCVPRSWQQARVTTIYKKGAVDDCKNYRPISLLSVTYKAFAAILLHRLQRGGAEDRLTNSQIWL